jgi:hypothetical protein
LKLASLFVAVMVMIIFYTGCIGDIINGDWFFYDYQLEIFPENETTQFEILIPIPVNATGEVEPVFMESRQIIHGNLNMEVNETPFGPALLINGTGEAEITFTFEGERDDNSPVLLDMSMLREIREEDEIGFFWAHSSQDNVSVRLNYHYDHSNGELVSRNYRIITQLNMDWQSVPATISENIFIE